MIHPYLKRILGSILVLCFACILSLGSTPADQKMDEDLSDAAYEDCGEISGDHLYGGCDDASTGFCSLAAITCWQYCVCDADNLIGCGELMDTTEVALENAIAICEEDPCSGDVFALCGLADEEL